MTFDADLPRCARISFSRGVRPTLFLLHIYTIVSLLTLPIRCGTAISQPPARSDQFPMSRRPRTSPPRKTSPAPATSMRPAGVPRSGRGQRGVLAVAHHVATAAAPRAAAARRSAPGHLTFMLAVRPTGPSSLLCSFGLSLCGSLAALPRAYGVAGEWKAALPCLGHVTTGWHAHIPLRALLEGRSRRKRSCEDEDGRGHL